MQIKIYPAPQGGGTDTLAKVLCETFEGEGMGSRLYNGVFSIPYEIIDQKLDQNKNYYFDRMNEQGQPEIYGWRYWGFWVENFVNSAKRNGYTVIEKDKEIVDNP